MDHSGDLVRVTVTGEVRSLRRQCDGSNPVAVGFVVGLDCDGSKGGALNTLT